MASSGKRKTTMAKLARESRLRERRMEKKARKDARRYAAEHPQPEREHDDPSDESLQEAWPGAVLRCLPGGPLRGNRSDSCALRVLLGWRVDELERAEARDRAVHQEHLDR